MKTSEIIQYVAKDLLDDRTDLVSGESDELFSDALIATHLAEAERILCRRAWVLEDIGASIATRIQLVEGKADYALDKSVIHVKSIRLSDSEIDLSRAGYDDNRLHAATDVDEPWDVNYSYVANPGRPCRYSLDMGTRNVRVGPKPNADAALLKLYLTVVRMPLSIISAAAPDKTPESPEEHHMALTLYAAGKCLMRPSVEAELRTLGRTYVKDFDAYVDEARRDRQRLIQSMPRHHFGSTTNGS